MEVPKLVKVSPSTEEKIQKECLLQREETIYVATDVTKLHEHGGKQTRILVISDGGVYIMVKPSKPKTIYMITSLERVVYTEQDSTIFFKFSDKRAVTCKTFTCKTSYALKIGEILLALHRAITFKVGDWKKQVRVESNPKDVLVYPSDQTKRAIGALKMRFMTFYNEQSTLSSNDEKQSLQLTKTNVLKQIQQWDAKPTTELKLTGEAVCKDRGLAEVIGKAIAYECDLRRLTLISFAPQSLEYLLPTVTSNSQFLLSLCLEGYKEACARPFEMRASERTRLEDLSFHVCSGDVVLPVMKGLGKFEGAIKLLTLTKSKLAASKWTEFFDLLMKTPCFVSLKRINFEDDTIDELDLKVLLSFLKSSKVTSLSIGNTRIDGGDLLNAIGSTMGMVKQFYFRRSRIFTRLSDSLAIAEQLTYLNFDRTEFEPDALKSLLKAILTKPRKKLLTIDMKEMRSAKGSDIVQCFDIPDIQPVIAELNFGNHKLTPQNLPLFVQFLKTQKYLLYLDVSNCFKENTDQCLSILSQYVIESKLQGLELNSDAAPLKESLVGFINSLAGKSHLQSLSIRGSAAGDEGLLALKKFVEASPKLTSLSCDGFGPTDPNVFVSAYNVFVRLDMLAKPNVDKAAMVKKGAALPPDLESKNEPKQLPKRLVDYENYDADSSAIIQPMDALMSIMSLMVNAIKNPDASTNILEQQNVLSTIQDSLRTSTVTLGMKAHGSDPILEMVGANSRTAEEIMTEFQTMHDF